jgi:hypothetical protein
MAWYDKPASRGRQQSVGFVASLVGAAGIVIGGRGLILSAMGVDRPDTDPSASLLVLLAGPFLLSLGIGMLRGKGGREMLFSPPALVIGALICIAAAGWTLWAQLTLGKSVLQAAPLAVLLSALGVGAFALARKRLGVARELDPAREAASSADQQPAPVILPRQLPSLPRTFEGGKSWFGLLIGSFVCVGWGVVAFGSIKWGLERGGSGVLLGLGGAVVMLLLILGVGYSFLGFIPGTHTLRLDAAGLTIRKIRGTNTYPWSEITPFEVFRLDEDRSLVCFWHGPGRDARQRRDRVFLPDTYEMDAAELAGLLNAYRERALEPSRAGP